MSSVLTPLKDVVNYAGVSQIACVTRYREPLKKDPDDDPAGTSHHTETACIITSLDAGQASPKRLLPLNRGHGPVENRNHHQRGSVFGEDACLARTGGGPANRARRNNIALALIFADRRGTEHLAQTRRPA